MKYYSGPWWVPSAILFCYAAALVLLALLAVEYGLGAAVRALAILLLITGARSLGLTFYRR
jgi:hypothetical protein